MVDRLNNKNLFIRKGIFIEREERSDLDYYIPSKKEIENTYQKGHPGWNLAQRRFKKKLTRDYKLPQEEAEKIIFGFYLIISPGGLAIKLPRFFYSI